MIQTISCDILIVGAGPTGLMLANQLTRFGTDFTIIDQKTGTTDQSRALVVQARSMEIYQQMGLSDQIIADGRPNDGVNLYREGRKTATIQVVDRDENRTPFPFLMMYEQSKNERLLYDHLLSRQQQVHWNTTVQSIHSENGQYIIETIREGNPVSYRCKYLIACDGSKSMVRDFSKVPFTGGTYLNVFYVVDTHIDGGFSSSQLSLFLTDQGVTMLFPMKGADHFRVLGILPKEDYHQDEFPLEQIFSHIKKDMAMPAKFYDTQWHSTYKLHHKKVARFSHDNIFFAGDAAHVHSPAGGQGMNTGLQDAYNLAWKLSLVQRGKAGPALLATYHEERNPVAEDLVKSTDRLFSGMVTDTAFFAFLRMKLIPFFVPLITKWKQVRKMLFSSVSQIRIAYPHSSLSIGIVGRVKAGDRCPYAMLFRGSRPVSVYDLIKEAGEKPFTLCAFNTDMPEMPDENDLFNFLTIESGTANRETLKRLGFPSSFVMMMRPDNYIGFIAMAAKPADITDFMKRAYSILS